MGEKVCLRLDHSRLIWCFQIKAQELEAAESLLPDSVFVRLEGTCSGSPVGFHLQMPVDPSTASSIESCVKALFGAGHLQAGAEGVQGVPIGDLHAVTLHILSPPGSSYPLEAPVVWIAWQGTRDSNLGEGTISPYGDDIGAVLCGAFAAHSVLRLIRPLKQLYEGSESPLGVSADSALQALPSVPKIISVLSSVTCETSLAELVALLQAAWQFEALLDDLLTRTSDGVSEMHSRWLTAATGSSTPRFRGPAAAAAAASEAAAAQEQLRWNACSPLRRFEGGPGARGAGSGNQDLTAGGFPGKAVQRSLHRSTDGPSAADLQLCRDIVKSVQHPASANAMSLPVRQHFDAIREFMRNRERQVLVVQGETGYAAYPHSVTR